MDTLMRSLFALAIVLACPHGGRRAAGLDAAAAALALVADRRRSVGHARGDCQTCETDYPYCRHDGSVLANAGYRVNQRMDVGLEVFWVPMGTAEGTIRTTHFDAVAQFRPWASQGFFMKGGAGMATSATGSTPTSSESLNSKALSWSLARAGSSCRPASRLPDIGSQHVAALGDLATIDGDIPDVVGTGRLGPRSLSAE
jgi:hypothetical protein